MAPQQIFTAGD